MFRSREPTVVTDLLASCVMPERVIDFLGHDAQALRHGDAARQADPQRMCTEGDAVSAGEGCCDPVRGRDGQTGSGREDLNLRLPRPKRGALPG